MFQLFAALGAVASGLQRWAAILNRTADDVEQRLPPISVPTRSDAPAIAHDPAKNGKRLTATR